MVGIGGIKSPNETMHDDVMHSNLGGLLVEVKERSVCKRGTSEAVRRGDARTQSPNSVRGIRRTRIC